MKKSTVAGLLILAALSLIPSACGGLKKTAIGGVAPVLGDVATAIFRQSDLTLVRTGLPGNMLMIEGMVISAPDNLAMLSMASKAFCGYAILIEDAEPERATAIYLKGREYGLRALSLHPGFRKAMAEGKPIEEAVHLINDKKYVDPLMWTGLNWGLYIMLNMTDPGVAVEATSAREIMKQVVKLDENYFYGMAHTFFGSYYAILPAMFGGGPPIVQEEFDKSFKVTDGKFLLSKVFYARYFATLTVNPELYDKTLNDVLEAPADGIPDALMMNTLAKEKAKKLLEEKAKYF